ncbi:MAG: Calx-beta domain-containing protein [Oleiphilaceae bacterium]
MRAELFPRTVIAMQVAAVLLLAVTASGCKTEKDPDQPTILGIPSAAAYLGVEYYYNFGAYGGEDILDYTLTNAPSWLALEDTSNKARQGIIMRGVPGLSGGGRGDADLGKLTGINLVTTDGQMSGAQPFDIEVKYNALSLEVDTFIEGASPTIPDTRRERCALPDLDTPGEHSFTVNTYDGSGGVSGTRDLTLPTRSVFAKILLEQPSVTRVAVAFELTSDYDASSCDPGVTAPHQRCDHSKANVGDAIPGQDIVALGSDSDPLLEDLPYLAYEADETGIYTGGVVTFEPGISECYIRLEVVDDSFAEPAETAHLTLTEVRSGLAGLGETNGGVSTTLVIDDNEPKVSLETTAGGTRDALNVGGSRTYVARLTGEREGAVYAKLKHSEDSSAQIGSEFSTTLPGDKLVFMDGEDEITFTINVTDSTSYSNAGSNDRFILLGLDTPFQLGRENYARAAGEDMLRVSINELTSPLVTNSGNGFVATDVAVGHAGRMFVAGYNSSDNDRVLVRLFDQKGALLQELDVSAPTDQLSKPAPVVSVAKREVTKNNTKSDRFELVVAYSTGKAVAGTTELGGMDVVSSLYWYNEASNGGEYVEAWTTRTGTSEDDIVRWAGLNSASGFVVIAGETGGEWPGQISGGGSDSFLQRIDSLADGNGFIPKLAWTLQVGSSADDQVAGGDAEGVSPLLFGSARGAVNGESSLGGEDAYFYTAASGDGNLTLKQRGTDADEHITSGVLEGSTLWLLGSGSNEYTVTQDVEDNLSLVSTPSSSASGFVLGYTTSGDLVRAFNLNDEGDASQEQFSAMTGFAGDLIAAGNASGDFTGDAVASSSAILARMSLMSEPEPDAESNVFRNQWRYQLNVGDSEVTRLANYRDDEVVALTRQSSAWVILLFSPEGVLLTP